MSKDTLELDLVNRFGFSPELPVFELYAEDLRFEDIFEALTSVVRECPCGIHFSFGSAADWRLLLVPEGLCVLESGPSNLLRGGVWHDQGARWIVSGWAQLYEPASGELVVGSCRLLTPAAGFGQESIVEACIGQLQLTDAEPCATPVAFTDDPGSLRS